MSEDQKITDFDLFVTAGHRYAMIAAAITKRTLLDDGIKPADRLHLLESMNKSTDLYFTEDMLRMIDPAGDLECQIVHEAMSLDRGREIADRIRHGSFNVLTSDGVWQHFCKLNPSIPAAIRQRAESCARLERQRQ